MTDWTAPEPFSVTDLAQRYKGVEFGPSIGDITDADGKVIATVHLCPSHPSHPRTIGLNITEQDRDVAIRAIEADDNLYALRQNLAAAECDEEVQAAVAAWQKGGALRITHLTFYDSAGHSLGRHVIEPGVGYSIAIPRGAFSVSAGAAPAPGDRS